MEFNWLNKRRNPAGRMPAADGSKVRRKNPICLHHLRKQFSALGEGLTLTTVAMLIALALLTGCQSAAQPGSGSHASVRISGAKEETIRLAIASVFQQNGYVLVSSLPEGMIFERPASRGDSFKWGGWGQGSSVVIRLKIKLETIMAGAHVVRCDVFYVSDRGDRVFEDERRLMLLDRRTYQKLLDEVSQQVQAP
jgi:hypothetical protein